MRYLIFCLLFIPAMVFSSVTNTTAPARAIVKNAGVFYQRGKEFYQNGNYGKALLNFQRAAIIENNNPLFKQAIKQTRELLNLPPMSFGQNVFEKILLFPFTFPSHNGMVIIGLILLIIGSLIWSGFLSRILPDKIQKNTALKRIGVTVFFLAVIYLAGALIRYHHDFDPVRAICVYSTPLFERPEQSLSPITTLSAGTECIVEKQSHGAYLIKSLNGEEGWAGKTNVIRLWKK